MSVPSLRIPVRAELAEFQRDMDKTRSLVSDVKQSVTRDLADVNSGFGSLAENAKTSALAIAGIGAAAVGIFAGGSGLLEKVLSFNKGLADLQSQAKAVGLSLADLQGLKLNALINGLSEAEFNTGLQKSAQLLNDASRNANTLSKELAENGIAVRETNVQMISQNRLLGIAADLIKRARNPGDQAAIAEMLGFTRAWIPLLEQGAEAMSGLTAEAQKAGAIISDETIERATEFDRQWRKSSVEFSAYMKAAALELLPYLDDLIDRAAKFIKGIDKGAIEKAAQEQLKAGADAIGLPEQAAVRIDIPQSVRDNWHKLGDEVVAVAKAIAAFDVDESVLSRLGKLYDLMTATPPSMADVKSKIGGLLPSVSMVPQDQLKWYAGTSPVMDTSEAAMASQKNAASWAQEGDAWKKLSAEIMSGADNIASGFSKVAKTGTDTSDAYGRAEESLLKYIEVTKAAAQSVDMTAAAQERFKAIAQLTAAGMKDGLTREAAAAKAEMSGLAVAAGNASGELAKARIASQNKFDAATAGLSAEDVAIAQRLRALYGDDIPAALNSTEAAAMRVNGAFRSVSQSIENNVADGLASIVDGTKSVKQGFSEMALSILKDMERMTIKALIVGPLMRAMGGAFGFGDSGAGAGPITFGGPNGPVPFYADGTDFAKGGLSLVGERGPELVNLPRGAQVIPNDVLRAGGGTNVTIGSTQIIVQGDASEKTLALLDAKLRQRDAEFHMKVVSSVKRAQSGRLL